MAVYMVKLLHRLCYLGSSFYGTVTEQNASLFWHILFKVTAQDLFLR